MSLPPGATKVVLFTSGMHNPEWDAALRAVETSGIPKASRPQFECVKVDCEVAENAGKCSEANFDDGKARMFINSDAGVEPWSGGADADAITEYVRFRGSEVEDSRVNGYTTSTAFTALRAEGYILAKFYTPWCGHCKRIAKHCSGLLGAVQCP
jgi:hypothetical protein